MSFELDFQCKIKCSQKPTVTKTYVDIFNTFHENLEIGDGWDPSNGSFMYRGFLTSNFLWAKEKCFLQAENLCHGFNNIDQVKALRVGEVEIERMCLKEQPNRIYPYSKIKGLSSNTPNAIITRRFLIEPKSKKLNSISKFQVTPRGFKSKCKNSVKFYRCFGDCLTYSSVTNTVSKNHPSAKKFSTVMFEMTNSIAQSDNVICIDDFVENIKQSHPPKIIRLYLCERFLWDTVFKERLMGSSCSSVRGHSNCSEVLHSLNL